jgi:tetratricopeptide (TPR) repeat protein
MRCLAMMINQYDHKNLSALIMGLAIGLASLPVAVSAQSDADDGLSPAQTEMVNNYEAAKAAGRHAEAAKYVLDYMEETEGENAPLTVTLTQRYGNLLRKEGDIREAISVLKTARERGIIAFGEHGPQLFEINLDLGEAYVDRNIGIGLPQKYFDDALEVLRENGQRETTLYVKTLVGITSRLTQAGVLDGALSADTAGVNLINTGGPQRNPGGIDVTSLIGTGSNSLTHTYQSGYRVLEGYMREAVELAEVLDIEDPYLSAKIAIVQAKTKVLENMFLEVVPANVRGSVSGVTARENYQREDSNLLSAIDVLKEDAAQNQDFLDIANSARMDIAWLSEDMQRMANFCSGDTLNMASRYPPDRLFEIAEDGSVISPRFSFRISSNIFERLRTSRFDNERLSGPDREREKKPQFVPVCIDGRLMAALVNAPRVTIEEIE